MGYFIEEFHKNRDAIEETVGYRFTDPTLLQTAFLHKSYCNEQRQKSAQHNERLEFLGDAVLTIIVSDFLYHKFPSNPEGELSDFRSRLVETKTLSSHTQKLGLTQYLICGQGEKKNMRKESLEANLFEALLGALYLDGGITTAHKFLFEKFEGDMDALLYAPSRNWKALLQDYVQKNLQMRPEYVVAHEEGPDHKKTFHVSVLIKGELVGSGHGSSKKDAEREAARIAIKKIGLHPHEEE